MVTSLTDLAGELETQLGPAGFRGLATRVLLRTGIALRPPKPERDLDARSIFSVIAVLSEMGYEV